MNWLSKAIVWVDRKFLIRSAQRKIRDGFAFGRITEAEWNALAHKPMSDAIKKIRADEQERMAEEEKRRSALPKPPAM